MSVENLALVPVLSVTFALFALLALWAEAKSASFRRELQPVKSIARKNEQRRRAE